MTSGHKVLPASESLDPAAPETLDPPAVRLWSDREDGGRPGGMAGMDRPTLLALIPAIIIFCMSLLGWQVNAFIRAQALEGYAETDAHRATSVLGPLLRGVDLPLEASLVARIDDLISRGAIRRNTLAAKIITRDGTIIYSMQHEQIGLSQPLQEIEQAFRGRYTTQFDHPADGDGEMQSALPAPLIETYVPIVDEANGGIVFAADFYHDGRSLQQSLGAISVWVWSSIVLATGLMLALLFLVGWRGRAVILRQQAELRHRLRATMRLSRRNQRLMQAADAARSEAIRNNQEYLSMIGSHLHDGPVQLLALLILQLSGRTGDGADGGRDRSIAFARQVLEELRALSHGLVLPELEHLEAREVIELAVRRHSEFTDTSVDMSIEGTFPEDLDSAIKLCLYRIVQEGLTNAYKHAEGIGQAVTVVADETRISVSVRNDGTPGEPGDVDTKGSGLGLIGLRRHVRAVSGTMTATGDRQSGMELHVSLPTVLSGGLKTPRQTES